MVVEREEGEEGGKRKKDKGADGAMCGQWKPREAMQGALRGKQKRSYLDGTRFCGLLRALAGSFRALLLRVSARSSRALAASCGLLRAFAEILAGFLLFLARTILSTFFRPPSACWTHKSLQNQWFSMFFEFLSTPRSKEILSTGACKEGRATQQGSPQETQRNANKRRPYPTQPAHEERHAQRNQRQRRAHATQPEPKRLGL